MRKRRNEIRDCQYYLLCLDIAAYNDDLFVNCRYCRPTDRTNRAWFSHDLNVAFHLLRKITAEFVDYKVKLIMRHFPRCFRKILDKVISPG